MSPSVMSVSASIKSSVMDWSVSMGSENRVILCGLSEVLSDGEDSVATAATAHERQAVVFPVELALAEQAEATHRGVAIGIF